MANAIDELIGELERHPAFETACARIRTTVLAAAHARRSIGRPEGEAAPPPLEGDAKLSFGDLGSLLEQGPADPQQGLGLAVLAVLALRSTLESETAPEALAADLTWLSAHTRVDVLGVLDPVLGSAAAGLWKALRAVIEEPEAHGLDVADAVVAAGALAASRAPGNAAAAADLAARSTAPQVRRALTPPEPIEPLDGQLEPSPRGSFVTALLGFTGVLFLAHLGRGLGWLALGFRRPARVWLSPRGLELSYRTLLLGRTLHERNELVPLASLERASREVRFARAGLYAGLAALGVGSYLGLALFIDGLRVGSPSLLGLGLLTMLLGLGIDFGLTAWSDAVRGKCRLVVTPRRGRAFAIGGLEPARADALLRALADEVAARPPA